MDAPKPSPDFDDAPTTERKAPQPGTVLLTLTHSEPGKFAPLDDDDLIDDDATIEPAIDPIPNPRTCGVARARVETGGESEPEWRKVLERAINASLWGDRNRAENAEHWRNLDRYTDCTPRGARCGNDHHDPVFEWGDGFDQTWPDVVAKLWPFEQLRRVVLEGKGKAGVPREVAVTVGDYCASCTYDCMELPTQIVDGEWICQRRSHRYPVRKTAWLEAIDAAATESIR